MVEPQAHTQATFASKSVARSSAELQVTTDGEETFVVALSPSHWEENQGITSSIFKANFLKQLCWHCSLALFVPQFMWRGFCLHRAALPNCSTVSLVLTAWLLLSLCLDLLTAFASVDHSLLVETWFSFVLCATSQPCFPRLPLIAPSYSFFFLRKLRPSFKVGFPLGLSWAFSLPRTSLRVSHSPVWILLLPVTCWWFLHLYPQTSRSNYLLLPCPCSPGITHQTWPGLSLPLLYSSSLLCFCFPVLVTDVTVHPGVQAKRPSSSLDFSPSKL